jgi:hypothetical protein
VGDESFAELLSFRERKEKENASRYILIFFLRILEKCITMLLLKKEEGNFEITNGTCQQVCI